MMSKLVPCSTSSCLKPRECGEDVLELRQKLSSVGWVQCDNPNCLKWRQVRLPVLHQLTEDTPWTCNMNEDDNYNRCSIPEEDTSSYERLAKKAKLDIITSRLKPGALVWAKVQGYCRWPALITADPLNGEHTDEDNFEAVAYHVEFLGGKRSHGWIRNKSIEVFGPGNIESAIAASQVQQGPARKLKNGTSVVWMNRKHGCHKVHMAIDEALQLLPLPMEARLQTCQFVTVSDVNSRIQADGLQQSSKMNCTYNLRQALPAPEHNASLTADTHGLVVKCSHGQQQVHKDSSLTENRGHATRRAVHSLLPSRQLQAVGHCLDRTTLSAHAGNAIRKPDFVGFPSSLIGSSKEARFMEDVQMYQHNEQLFERELALFNARYSLSPPEVPTWQNMQASKYSMFLAVLDRGGYLCICEKRQWQCVYTEVSNLCCRQGAGLCRQYYQRYLYPFELYVCGNDYTPVVNQYDRCVEQPMRESPGKEAGDSGVDTDDLETWCDDDEFDSPDIIKHLDELDQILMSLDQAGDRSGHIQDNTSEVAPLTRAPILVRKCTSADDSSPDTQVLLEMQALQQDLDFLQDEINLL